MLLLYMHIWCMEQSVNIISIKKFRKIVQVMANRNVIQHQVSCSKQIGLKAMSFIHVVIHVITVLKYQELRHQYFSTTCMQ